MLLSISPIELQIVERELIEIAFYIFVCLLFYFLFIRRARKYKALADDQNLEQDPLTDTIPHSGNPLLELATSHFMAFAAFCLYTKKGVLTDSLFAVPTRLELATSHFMAFAAFSLFTKKGVMTDSLFAVPTRLELATSGVTGRHSNQLNYSTSFSA